MPSPERELGDSPVLDIFLVEEEEYFGKLSDQIEVLSQQVTRAQKEPAEGNVPSVEPGDWVRLKVHKRKWTEPRWIGPFEVVAKTSHALQVRGHTKTKWHHLTHCLPADPPAKAAEPTADGIPEQDENLEQNGEPKEGQK